MLIQNDIENIGDKENKKRKVEETENVVDSKLELSDPTPDVHQLFRIFDSKYFGGLLSRSNVLVEWDNRTFLAAGKFVPRCRCEHAKPPTIRLSTKLLKYRPRKDLVETLLVR